MGVVMGNIGEDEGSAVGGGDSSSGNSGFIRNQSFKLCLPFTAAGDTDECKHRNNRLSTEATSTTVQENLRTIKSQPRTAQEVMLEKKKGAMTRPFAQYGTLRSEQLSDNGSATPWPSDAKNWVLKARDRLRKWPILNPRGATRINKNQTTCPNRSSCLKANVPFGLEESGDDPETSTNSYSSSCSSHSSMNAVAIPMCSSSLSVGDRWELQHALLKQSRKAGEHSLLHSYPQGLKTDIESDCLLKVEIESDAHPDIKTEVRKLFALAYPVTFTYVLEFFPQLVSMTLVGHLDSPLTKQYLDGVALSTMCMNLTAIGIGFGLATAMDTLCSQAYGAGKPKKLGIYFQSGLIVLGLAMIPVFIINWYTEAFLVMTGQPAQVAKFAGRFSRILLPGIPAVYVYEMVKKVMQAQNVVLPMVHIAVISNLVNLLLGIYLTFFTSLGFDSAAIARLLSEVVLPLCLIPYFMWNPHIPAEWWPGWQAKQAVHHLGTFLRLGLPGAAMMLLEWWSFEIMAAFVGWLPSSVVAISVHSVLVSVSTFAFNFFLGISVAANVLVGNYLGSNKPHHANMASTVGMILSVSLSAVIAIIIIATRYLIPKIFINDAVSIGMAEHALLFLMPYQMCDAINAVMQGVFRGTGRLLLGTYINLLAYFVIGLPFGVYLAFRMDMGVEGMWLGLTAGIFFGCVVSFIKICETNWKSMADAARVLTS
ncbi:unnamed protein product [Peronospora belbahrii]|uniref:Multidrug and toxin extrusion protein n=1 Tax=Peronospora belbahrii TaxID=622444 RepID=A0ABN8D6L9_9STRA|nr:unnamed protein product [Peronospora belbahrii]